MERLVFGFAGARLLVFATSMGRFFEWEGRGMTNALAAHLEQGWLQLICVAAIFQAIVAKLWKLRRDNMTCRIYPAELVEENKWRAARCGLDGKLIDFGKHEELPARDLIRELVA